MHYTLVYSGLHSGNNTLVLAKKKLATLTVSVLG
jgi:hypothetical protein